MSRIARSFQLLDECFGVLRQDPELLVFPVLSAVCFLAVVASFAVPVVVAAGGAHAMAHGAGHFAFSGAQMVLGIAFYFFTYFVMAFFNVALVSCARIRLEGGDPTLGDGFRAALERLGPIAAWVLVAATVGWVLHTIQERVGFIGKIVTGLIGAAWSIATALVVPVLAFEEVGPIDAVKRSTLLLKKTWGEQLVGGIGLGSLAFVGFLIAAAVGVGGAIALPQIWFVPAAIGVCLLGLTAVVQSTLQGIFRAAVYAYATTGQVPPSFSPELVQGAYRNKR